MRKTYSSEFKFEVAFEKNSKDLKKIKLLKEEQTRLYSVVGELIMQID